MFNEQIPNETTDESPFPDDEVSASLDVLVSPDESSDEVDPSLPPPPPHLHLLHVFHLHRMLPLLEPGTSALIWWILGRYLVEMWWIFGRSLVDIWWILRKYWLDIW